MGGEKSTSGAGPLALTSPNLLLLYLAVADFIVHMLVAGNYGYFRDELYYIVAGQHLAPGYVDFPPMIAFLAAAVYAVSHDSLVSIHVVPALPMGQLWPTTKVFS